MATDEEKAAQARVQFASSKSKGSFVAEATATASDRKKSLEALNGGSFGKSLTGEEILRNRCGLGLATTASR